MLVAQTPRTIIANYDLHRLVEPSICGIIFAATAVNHLVRHIRLVSITRRVHAL
jgi:predicted YcjX-like family ATPase